MNSCSNDGYSLILCRTPLQSKIANEIIKKISGKYVVIYYPTTKNIKNDYYYSKINAKLKYFLPWQPLVWSDALTGVLAWMRIPASIKNKKYNNLYISSIGDIPFSLFSGKNAFAEISSYDDGTFNINEENFLRWINQEPISYILIKKIMGGINNKKMFDRISCHYTIYPKKMLSWMRRQVEEIDLYKSSSSETRALNNRKKIRVLLGSGFVEPNLNHVHDHLCKSTRFDLFIPHPYTLLDTRVSEQFGELFLKYDLNLLVAEDVIIRLVSEGYRPIVYGFNSSALINLKKFTSVVSINIDDSFSGLANDLRRFGIKIIECRKIKGS
jgi:hypothetical protein